MLCKEEVCARGSGTSCFILMDGLNETSFLFKGYLQTFVAILFNKALLMVCSFKSPH